MAYQLKTSHIQVDESAVPPVCATDSFQVYPQPATPGNCCRPSTMIYGTAPYFAGKGAPAELVDVQDRLRPQSTTRFGNVLVKRNDGLHPLQDVSCAGPVRVRTTYPRSSRGDVQNILFHDRYF